MGPAGSTSPRAQFRALASRRAGPTSSPCRVAPRQICWPAGGSCSAALAMSAASKDPAGASGTPALRASLRTVILHRARPQVGGLVDVPGQHHPRHRRLPAGVVLRLVADAALTASNRRRSAGVRPFSIGVDAPAPLISMAMALIPSRGWALDDQLARAGQAALDARGVPVMSVRGDAGRAEHPDLRVAVGDPPPGRRGRWHAPPPGRPRASAADGGQARGAAAHGRSSPDGPLRAIVRVIDPRDARNRLDWSSDDHPPPAARDRQPHRRRRGGRAAGQRGQGTGRERHRRRREPDRGPGRRRRPGPHPGGRRRPGPRRRGTAHGAGAPRHLQARARRRTGPTTCCASPAWASAARRCRRSARWRA